MKFILVLVISVTLAGCTDVTRDTVNGVLNVGVSMGDLGEHGTTLTKHLGVILDGDRLPLSILENAEIVGLNGRDLLFLSGTDIVLDGKLRDGVYYARYVRFLDQTTAQRTPGNKQTVQEAAELAAELAEEIAASEDARQIDQVK